MPASSAGLETFTLGGTEKRLTRIGLGGCPLGGHGWGPPDDAAAKRAVNEAFDRGINLFDTADCYGFGASERLLASALGERRHEVVIASKFGVRWQGSSGKTWKDTSPGYLRTALEASLRRLGLDCLPLYFVHWTDGKTPIEATMEELVRCRDEGKIRWIGLSNVTEEELRAALSVATVNALQLLASVVRAESMATIVPLAADNGISVLTWGSLAQGLLAGRARSETPYASDDRRSRYEDFQGERLVANLGVADKIRGIAERTGRTMAQVAIRWLLDSEGVAAALVGAKRPEQIKENAGALGWTLAAEDYEELQVAAKGALLR